MTEKYKLITLDPNSKVPHCSAEVAERLAFSFGYSWWGANDKQVKPVAQGRYLVFNVDEKSITTVSLSIAPQNSVQVWTADGLIEALTNPQLDAVTLTSKEGNASATIFEDSITFRSNTSKLVGTATIPKELFEKIAGAVRGRGALPVVWFTYPNSSGFGSTVRYVAVTRMDEEYIQGFEGSNASGALDGTFKKYSRDRVSGPVNLHRFLQKES